MASCEKCNSGFQPITDCGAESGLVGRVESYHGTRPCGSEERAGRRSRGAARAPLQPTRLPGRDARQHDGDGRAMRGEAADRLWRGELAELSPVAGGRRHAQRVRGAQDAAGREEPLVLHDRQAARRVLPRPRLCQSDRGRDGRGQAWGTRARGRGPRPPLPLRSHGGRERAGPGIARSGRPAAPHSTPGRADRRRRCAGKARRALAPPAAAGSAIGALPPIRWRAPPVAAARRPAERWPLPSVRKRLSGGAAADL